MISEITKTDLSVYSFKKPYCFDIAKIFDCGQCFRFDPVENSKYICEYSGVAHGRFVSFADDGESIIIFGSDEKDFRDIWKGFLSLDRNYEAIYGDIMSRSDNPALKCAVDVGNGIRILKQDLWEALCSFIISQNNNIPRIKGIIANLSMAAGERIDTVGLEAHGARLEEYAFPTPEAILSLGVDGLTKLKTGFRAKYIYDAAEKVASGDIDLSYIESMCDTEEAARLLTRIKGVGPKVAACTLLFGASMLDSFPIDVWIKKVISKYFNEGFTPNELGEYAGVAQQVLFYYERYTQQ